MNDRPRGVFLGSGAFAVPILAVLAASPAVWLRAVVTAPAGLAGRARAPHRTPVGTWATEHGLPTLAPERLRSPAAVAAVIALRPDLLVLADYGQLVPPALLEAPAHGALNLHPSLLPRHRGASPVAAAILAGDAEAGVTLMLMDAGLDSGPIVAQLRTPIGPEETAPQLEARLAALAAELLGGALAPWLAGRLPARPQPAAGATLTRPLRREDGRLDPTLDADALVRQVRALQPWPGTFAITLAAGRLVLWRVAAAPLASLPGAPAADPGTLLGYGDGLALRVGGGLLRLLEVQPAGGRRMSGAELRRGRPGLVGSRVGHATLA